ncbi:MAG TPA: carboxylating nicotinate-nucleotide diphosphorylase [Phycisphaerae bacterium]|nr:carboxylating nicotinate-nucleotide diphosphorylase [Phycisphaerae bacterium]
MSRQLYPNNIDFEALDALLALARREDFGDAGDITTCLTNETFPETGRWTMVSRQAGTLCGLTILPRIIESLCPEVLISDLLPNGDGSAIAAGSAIVKFSGNRRQMLGAERTILNFLQHLSGIATETARFVSAIAGTKAQIFDTRKMTPGFRSLEKYAVRCGGGQNHRSGLYDAVLIKDNHLAGVPAGRIAHAVFEMLNRIGSLSRKPEFVEVECDGLIQLEELLKVVGIDVILLDNFTMTDLRAAVSMRDNCGLREKVALEASGGVTLATVRQIADTGVDRIAVGAITHSAPALDIGLDAE